MADFFSQYSGFFIKIFAAVVCGGIIGLEREVSGKAAGLRTNILICMGATIYMVVSDLVPKIYGVPADPGRIAAQVVTGIGFIGAGSIIRSGATVAGLTTAATIWIVAAIGLVIGIGFPFLAILFTLVVLLVLAGLRKVETRFNLGDKSNNLNQDNLSDSQTILTKPRKDDETAE
ncbi:MAG: MgtC/SapB family protein [FCB group bacterium]|nr:MgtC/SapB family protein [FCB group bacterium]